MKNIAKYLPYLLKITFPVCLLFLVTIIGSLLLFTQPFIYKIIYDELIPTYDKELLLCVIVSSIAIMIISSMTNLLMEIITIHIRGKLISYIRNDIILEILFYRYLFFTKNSIGDVIQRIIPEVDALSFTIASTVKALAYIFQLIMILIISLLFNFGFFIICILSLFVYIIWNSVFKRPVGHYTSRIQKMQGELYGYFYENLQNIKLIKLFNNYTRTIEHLEKRLVTIKRLSLTNTFFQSLLLSATKILDFAIIVILIYSIYKITSGEMTVGFYLLFTMLITRLVVPVNYLIDMVNNIQSGKVAAQRIQEIRGKEIENSGNIKFTSVQEFIEFKNVEFQYEKSRTILNGISFRIEKGNKVAFVGASGSGKSTIIQLLIRLYDSTKGTISIDGNLIQSYDLTSLRENIGVLSQDFYLFCDTIKNNIDPKELHSKKELGEIINKADLRDFNEKLNFNIGEGGWNLSGGERQRLSIARLLARKPSVIILDEATSNLDPRTEQIIMDNIQLLKDQIAYLTLIMITHRTQHLSEMDKIFFIEEGKISDSGLHKDLIHTNQRYSDVLHSLNTQKIK